MYEEWRILCCSTVVTQCSTLFQCVFSVFQWSFAGMCVLLFFSVYFSIRMFIKYAKALLVHAMIVAHLASRPF